MPVKERGAGKLFKQGRLNSVSAGEDEGYWEENIALIKEALEQDFAELKAGQAKILEVLTEQGEQITEIKSSLLAIERNIATMQRDINAIKSSLTALAEKKG